MAILSYLQALLPMQQFSCLLQPKALSQVTPINAPTANQPSHTYTSSTNTANAMIVLTSVQSQSANSIPKASHSAKISHGTEYLFTTTTAYPKPQLEDTFVHMPTANIRRRASSERTISIDMSAKCTPDSHDRTTNTTRHFSRQGDHNPGK
ncbi:hypothetical protein DL98DRAFT_530266 [Cadophora sp. DSE1049]|nr:hypothetical protein DL98DRAFT_530266 [Cadophora sp. DSE1049]